MIFHLKNISTINVVIDLNAIVGVIFYVYYKFMTLFNLLLIMYL